MLMLDLVVPLAAAFCAAACVVSFQHRIGARAVALYASSCAVLIAIAGYLSALLVAADSWLHAGWFDRLVPALAMADHASGPSTVTGATASTVVLVGTVRLVGALRKERALRSTSAALRSVSPGPVLVNPSDDVFAYSVPGRTPLTIVSAGLIDQLPETALQVVLAHESAHHDFRHDRLLLAGRAASALFAPVLLLARGAQHALERWADDHAAAVVGDRRVVARTVAAVALLSAGSPSAHGFAPFAAAGRFGAGGRVRSLLQPPEGRVLSAVAIPGVAFAGLALAGVAVQVWTIVEMATAICRL